MLPDYASLQIHAHVHGYCYIIILRLMLFTRKDLSLIDSKGYYVLLQ